MAFAGIGIVLLLLLVVYVTDGKRIAGCTPASFSIQPSEFAKPALALFLAYFISHRLGAINDKYTLLPIALSHLRYRLVCGGGRFGNRRGAGSHDHCGDVCRRARLRYLRQPRALACFWASASSR